MCYSNQKLFPVCYETQLTKLAQGLTPTRPHRLSNKPYLLPLGELAQQQCAPSHAGITVRAPDVLQRLWSVLGAYCVTAWWYEWPPGPRRAAGRSRGTRRGPRAARRGTSNGGSVCLSGARQAPCPCLPAHACFTACFKTGGSAGLPPTHTSTMILTNAPAEQLSS